MEFWFGKQEHIGGLGKKVEIDETLLVSHKYYRGMMVRQVRVFGETERQSKLFVVLLVDPEEQDKIAATLITFIQGRPPQGKM